VTVLEVIQRSAEFLARKGVDSPRLQTELILAHLLQVPRLNLYLDFERVLTEAEASGMRELVRRRGQREPLQHITGTTSFCGLDLGVDRRALIPRPETELLAERGWEFLLQVSRDEKTREPVALDLGTGSGCLAIALATRCPAARIYALDISPDALALARENALRHVLPGQIQFIQGGSLEALPPGVTLDLLISNPPYVATEQIQTLEPEVRDYDPRAALDGGADGLDFYRYLAVRSGAFLSAGGKLMVEVGDGQAASVRGLFETQNWVVEGIHEDYNQHPRILVARRQ
jgi:release factor glutamine methyltransferase